jgi:hypothetical protein
MKKIIITEKQLLRLRKNYLNEDAVSYGNLAPGTYRDCQGVGDIKKCLATSGTLKFDMNTPKPYHVLVYKVAQGDNIGTILQKIGKDGYEVKNPMEYNTLVKNENEIKPNDVLIFDFGV